jgi:integrase
MLLIASSEPKKNNPSPEFRVLSDRTKKDYKKHKVFIEKKWSDTPLKLFGDAEKATLYLSKWSDDLASELGDCQGKNVFSTMRRLLSYAVSKPYFAKYVKVNYALEIKSAYKANRAGIVWKSSSADYLTPFYEKAPKLFHLPVKMALDLARREADLLAITWGDYDGTHVMVGNHKGATEAKMRCECSKELKEALDAHKKALGRIPDRRERILTTVTGKAWTVSHFSTKFSAAKNDIEGLEHLHFHDLRGTAITILANEGCTHQEIAAVTGHSVNTITKIIEHYMCATQEQNANAIRKLNQSRERKEREQNAKAE